MERIFKRKAPENDSEDLSGDLENLPSDPADRKRILEYHPNQIDKTKYGDWLKYSMKKKDKAFCLFCYLFRDYTENKAGSDAYVTKGFDNWKNTERLRNHVGAIFVSTRIPFRGHDESVDSTNKGDFLEIVKHTTEQNELVSKVVLDNAPKNNQMVSIKIQTEIFYCFVEELIESVIQEVDHDIFCLLVDESADVSDKEQMAVVFRFVDKYRIVKERFIGLVHVKETSSLSLKCAVDSLFAKHRLSTNKLRGEGYDGASNMKVEFNGLTALILRENNSTYYVVIAIAQKHLEVGNFFDMIDVLLNVVGASYKRKDMVREDYRKRIEEKTKKGEIKTWQGLNQELLFQRPVKSTKQQLYKLRNNGWKSFINKVFSFCENYMIELLVMEKEFIISKKPSMKSNKTILHHYKTKKHLSHLLVYQLLKLVLTLHVLTAIVERCFSGMKIVKTVLQKRMSDQFLNDCVVCFVEKELLERVKNEVVMKRFQNMELFKITL
ncbi:hypothetical protein EUTSA_v10029343mg [Eutrema salsugineum]|uniref:TTF-type domain-containing protein n=1 Tax=Eutrema salsugineum TaxID=72664 RepID=V4L501_EUTSA|nr:hypothetical protein EUTSA_v10029343mg [Eutrema salsugineum]